MTVPEDYAPGDERRYWLFFTFCQQKENKQFYDIMQFTGLTYKNGKEIYEGDVLKYFNPATKVTSLHLIVWEQGKARFGMQALTGMTAKEGPRPMIQHSESRFDEKGRFELIGNVYQNPKLLS